MNQQTTQSGKARINPGYAALPAILLIPIAFKLGKVAATWVTGDLSDTWLSILLGFIIACIFGATCVACLKWYGRKAPAKPSN